MVSESLLYHQKRRVLGVHLARAPQALARVARLDHLLGDVQAGALGLLQVLNQRYVLQDVALRGKQESMLYFLNRLQHAPIWQPDR